MTDNDDEHVDGHKDDVDTGDEDDEPVVDAGGGKEADGVQDVDEDDTATESDEDADANVADEEDDE